eukprot:1223843-Rhodomonas_salina.1
MPTSRGIVAACMSLAEQDWCSLKSIPPSIFFGAELFGTEISHVLSFDMELTCLSVRCAVWMPYVRSKSRRFFLRRARA